MFVCDYVVHEETIVVAWLLLAWLNKLVFNLVLWKVADQLKRDGLESAKLTFGFDFTESNERTGLPWYRCCISYVTVRHD